MTRRHWGVCPPSCHLSRGRVPIPAPSPLLAARAHTVPHPRVLPPPSPHMGLHLSRPPLRGKLPPSPLASSVTAHPPLFPAVRAVSLAHGTLRGAVGSRPRDVARSTLAVGSQPCDVAGSTLAASHRSHFRLCKSQTLGRELGTRVPGRRLRGPGLHAPAASGAARQVRWLRSGAGRAPFEGHSGGPASRLGQSHNPHSARRGSVRSGPVTVQWTCLRNRLWEGAPAHPRSPGALVY